MHNIDEYRFLLFVSGSAACGGAHVQIVRDLLRDKHCHDKVLQVIDVLAEPLRADIANVWVTPSLVIMHAQSTIRLVGEPADIAEWLDGPGLAASPPESLDATPLRDSEVPYRDLLDKHPQAVLVLSPQGMVLFANVVAQDLFERPIQSMVGSYFGRPVRCDRPTVLELRRPGERPPVSLEMHLSPTLWGGQPAWAAAFSFQPRHKHPDNSHQLLASIVKSSDYAIISKSLQGTITSWNAGAEKIFGYRSAEAMGQSILMLFPPESVDEEKDIISRIARGERVQAFEALRVRRDGRRIHVAVSISPIVNDDGVVVGASKIASDISQRTEANDKLARNATLLRIASRAARLGGWALELPARKLVWSDEVCRLHKVPLGVAPSVEDAIEFYAPEYRHEVVRNVEKCLSDGTAYDLKAEILTTSGNRLWVRAMGEAVRDGSGSIVGVQGAFQDISEQEAAAREIHKLGARIVSTLESITDAFFTLDCVWKFSYINAEAERLLQQGREALLGRVVWEAFPDAVGTSFESNYRHAVENGVTVAFEEFYPQLDKWFEVRAYPSVDGLAVYFRDATERRRQQATLQASDERFQLVSKATNDAIWDWDVNANRFWWNEGFEKLVGYTKSDIEPGIDVWTSRIHPADKDRVLAEIQKSIERREERWSNSYRFRRMDGSYAQVLDRGYVVRDSNGAVVRRVGGMTDITERILLEERLRQSQRLESVGQLTGGVAHDFNNLLTVILGNAELLVNLATDNTGQRELAQMIVSAASRGAEFTQRLLAFARKQALDPKVIDVGSRLADLDHLLRRALGEHISIEIVHGENLWHALVDPSQLENALLNLCINARDAMPAGGRLVIEATNAAIDENYAASRDEVRAGDYVMLAVSDTGTGIAPENLTRIFEPFYTTKAKGKGTGLGLAMVWGFVKQSGGHAAVYSELGKGTTVKIYLPRADPEAAVSTLRVAEGPVVGGTELILMVEDDAFVRRYAESQLRRLGYTVLVAENGHQAMEILLGRDDVDLLFTDIVMPGMGGRELVEKALAIRPHLRVLYTSGYTENAIVHQGRLDPGVMLLSKPYRRADMARKIRDALSQP